MCLDNFKKLNIESISDKNFYSVKKSKFSFLLKQYLLQKKNNYENEFSNISSIEKVDNSFSSDYSDYSLIYEIPEDKISLEIYYTLNTFYYEKIKINCNKYLTIKNLISIIIENINQINKFFKINENEDNYEIRPSQKNGFPNYKLPICNYNDTISYFINQPLTLTIKIRPL